MCCEPGQGARTTLHAVVRFQCAAGMKLEGEADRATCTAAGRWSHPVPRCLAPCILPDIQHGNIRDSTGTLMRRPQQIYFCLLLIKSSLLNNAGDFFTVPVCEKFINVTDIDWSAGRVGAGQARLSTARRGLSAVRSGTSP